MSSKVLKSFKIFDDDYQIKFIEPDNVDASVELLKKFYLPYEPVAVSLGISKDAQKVEEILEFWRKVIEEEKVSIGCFKVENDGSEKLIGVNVLAIKRKSNEEDKNELLAFRQIRNLIEKFFNVFEHYNVENLLYAYGLTVDRSYNGRGIATEMLKSRVEVLKFLNLKVTSTIFASAAIQKAAIKAGYEENFMKTYEEIHKIDERIFLPGLENECMKVMSMRI